MLHHIRKYTFMIFIVLLGGITASGQDFDALCQQLFQNALQDVGENCEGLAPNSICYGYGTVNASFVDSDGNAISSEDVIDFKTVGDQIALSELGNNQYLKSIETIVFDPLSEESEDESINNSWGIAAISSAANNPQQLEGSGVSMLLFGETRITDMTPSAKIYMPGTIATVSVENAEIFSAPPEYPIASTVIDTVSGEFEADAISPDGEWVRVYYTYERRLASRTTAWLTVESLLDTPDLSELPLLGADYGAPMQHIALEMATDQPQCGVDKTGGVLIQGKDAIETDLSINGVHIRISSVVFVDLIEANLIKIVVLDGIVELFPESEESIPLVSGFSIEISFEETEDGEIIYTVGEPILENNFVLNEYDGITDNAPETIVAAIPESVVITASGNGNPINVVVLRDNEEANRINQYCESGVLPDYICVRFSQ